MQRVLINKIILHIFVRLSIRGKRINGWVRRVALTCQRGAANGVGVRLVSATYSSHRRVRWRAFSSRATVGNVGTF